MKIGNYEHKGFEFTVSFSSDGDWREHKNMFYAECGVFNSGYHKTFDGAADDMKSQIDVFLSGVPTDVDDLVDKLSELLVWTGYEECELDCLAAKSLIEAFIKKDKGEL